MDHTISCNLAQGRIADLRHHAQRDTLARAARRRARRRCPGLIPWELGRRRAVPGDRLGRSACCSRRRIGSLKGHQGSGRRGIRRRQWPVAARRDL